MTTDIRLRLVGYVLMSGNNQDWALANSILKLIAMSNSLEMFYEQIRPGLQN